ncbi:SAM-dependent methyltransferase [Actinomycetospora chibensis]|uniref:SAM-dependent methyltransferase n=1 Tax=Actinomycetospora chibensis TaxID=663606 RepID=A0ABV9RR07_9PSEU
MTAGSGDEDRWPESERALEAGIDFDRANAARIYEYMLGGAYNVAVDREQAATILDLGSGVPTVGNVHEIALAQRPDARVHRGSATEVVLRSRPEITDLLGGLDLVPPGMVDIVDWPTTSPGERPTGGYAAIARVL